MTKKAQRKNKKMPRLISLKQANQESYRQNHSDSWVIRLTAIGGAPSKRKMQKQLLFDQDGNFVESNPAAKGYHHLPEIFEIDSLAESYELDKDTEKNSESMLIPGILVPNIKLDVKQGIRRIINPCPKTGDKPTIEKDRYVRFVRVDVDPEKNKHNKIIGCSIGMTGEEVLADPDEAYRRVCIVAKKIIPTDTFNIWYSGSWGTGDGVGFHIVFELDKPMKLSDLKRAFQTHNDREKIRKKKCKKAKKQYNCRRVDVCLYIGNQPIFVSNPQSKPPQEWLRDLQRGHQIVGKRKTVSAEYLLGLAKETRERSGGGIKPITDERMLREKVFYEWAETIILVSDNPAINGLPLVKNPVWVNGKFIKYDMVCRRAHLHPDPEHRWNSCTVLVGDGEPNFSCQHSNTCADKASYHDQIEWCVEDLELSRAENPLQTSVQEFKTSGSLTEAIEDYIDAQFEEVDHVKLSKKEATIEPLFELIHSHNPSSSEVQKACSYIAQIYKAAGIKGQILYDQYYDSGPGQNQTATVKTKSDSEDHRRIATQYILDHRAADNRELLTVNNELSSFDPETLAYEILTVRNQKGEPDELGLLKNDIDDAFSFLGGEKNASGSAIDDVAKRVKRRSIYEGKIDGQKARDTRHFTAERNLVAVSHGLTWERVVGGKFRNKISFEIFNRTKEDRVVIQNPIDPIPECEDKTPENWRLAIDSTRRIHLGYVLWGAMFRSMSINSIPDNLLAETEDDYQKARIRMKKFIRKTGPKGKDKNKESSIKRIYRWVLDNLDTFEDYVLFREYLISDMVAFGIDRFMIMMTISGGDFKNFWKKMIDITAIINSGKSVLTFMLMAIFPNSFIKTTEKTLTGDFMPDGANSKCLGIMDEGADVTIDDPSQIRMFKAITGGGTSEELRMIYQSGYAYTFKMTLLRLANTPIVLKDQTGAAASRVWNLAMSLESDRRNLITVRPDEFFPEYGKAFAHDIINYGIQLLEKYDGKRAQEIFRPLFALEHDYKKITNGASSDMGIFVENNIYKTGNKGSDWFFVDEAFERFPGFVRKKTFLEDLDAYPEFQVWTGDKDPIRKKINGKRLRIIRGGLLKEEDAGADNDGLELLAHPIFKRLIRDFDKRIWCDPFLIPPREEFNDAFCETYD